MTVFFTLPITGLLSLYRYNINKALYHQVMGPECRKVK